MDKSFFSERVCVKDLGLPRPRARLKHDEYNTKTFKSHSKQSQFKATQLKHKRFQNQNLLLSGGNARNGRGDPETIELFERKYGEERNFSHQTLSQSI